MPSSSFSNWRDCRQKYVSIYTKHLDMYNIKGYYVCNNFRCTCYAYPSARRNGNSCGSSFWTNKKAPSDSCSGKMRCYYSVKYGKSKKCFVAHNVSSFRLKVPVSVPVLSFFTFILFTKRLKNELLFIFISAKKR